MPVLPEMPLPRPPQGFLQRRALVNAHAAVERDRVRAAERDEAAAVLDAASVQAGQSVRAS